MNQQSGKWCSLAFFLLGCYTLEVFGGWLTSTSVHSWYVTLNKPGFNPPGRVFGPVWTMLYGMIAISGWIVYSRPTSNKKVLGLFIYGMQLLLNVLWSFLFFFLKSPLFALLDVIILFMLIVWMISVFWSLSKYAAWLLFPYLIWTGFALVLNIGIVMLN